MNIVQKYNWGSEHTRLLVYILMDQEAEKRQEVSWAVQP